MHVSILFLSGTALACASSACADPLSLANESGGSVTFYGQFSPALLGFDDGSETYNDLVDNAHSNSRVGFDFDQPLGNGQELRFNFETALGAPQSSDFSQESDPNWIWSKTDIRKLDLIFVGSFGKIYFGQGSMVTDGVAKQDLSKTTMVSTVTTNDTAGSYFFRAIDGTRSDVQLEDVFSNFDGSRKGRIRYDTPEWKGLRFGASYGTDILQDFGDTYYWDLGMYYEAEVGGMQYAAGLGYGWRRPSDGSGFSERWSGSFSVVHKPTGLNGTLATGAEIGAGNYVYGKAGWTADIWSAGATALSADYYFGQDFIADGSDSVAWGAQASQYIDSWNLQAYIGYGRYTYDDTSSVRYRDAGSLLTGAQWRF